MANRAEEINPCAIINKRALVHPQRVCVIIPAVARPMWLMEE
jgi:hypothetical protein